MPNCFFFFNFCAFIERWPKKFLKNSLKVPNEVDKKIDYERQIRCQGFLIMILLSIDVNGFYEFDLVSNI